MPEMHTYIAGVPYHKGARETLDKMADGESLVLSREPENKFDPHAVAVLFDGWKKMGYVPKVDARAIAKVLDKGLPCTCKLRKVGATKMLLIEWSAK